MVKNISVCIFAFLLIACNTPQEKKEVTKEEAPVEVVDVTAVEALNLPENVSIRNTDRGKVLVIDPSIIHFYKEKTTMYEGYEDTFSLAKEVLDMNPSVDIILEGHASKPGKAYLYNYNLSVDRSKTSLNYLESMGVNTNRLTVKGLGEGLTEYNTATKNRRLEFIIIEDKNDLNTYQNYIKNIKTKEESN